MEAKLDKNFPIQSWQFFLECREVLGMPKLQNIFGNVSTSQLYRWARNPDADTDAQPGPLIALARLFQLLREQGRAELAEAGLRMLAEACGAQVSFSGSHVNEAGLAPQSAAANLVEAVAELQRAARGGTDAKVVDALADVLMARAMELTQIVRAAQAGGTRPRWSRGALTASAATKPGLLRRILGRG